jgi:hypothetical protein
LDRSCVDPWNYTGAIVDFTVADTGTYDIVADGAQGGTGGGTRSKRRRGRGNWWRLLPCRG